MMLTVSLNHGVGRSCRPAGFVMNKPETEPAFLDLRFEACPKNKKVRTGLKIGALMTVPLTTLLGVIGSLSGAGVSSFGPVDQTSIYQAQELVNPILQARNAIQKEDLDNPTLVTESAQSFFNNIARTVIKNSDDDAALQQVNFLQTLNEPEQRLTRDLYFRLKASEDSGIELMKEWMDKVMVYHVPNTTTEQVKAELQRYAQNYEARLQAANGQYSQTRQDMNKTAKNYALLFLLSVVAGVPLSVFSVSVAENIAIRSKTEDALSV